MQKIRMALAGIAVALILVACGSSDKYADVKETLNKLLVANEKFGNSMEAAQDAAAVAKAVNEYASESGPTMKAFMGFRDKYPELGKKDGEVPADLKELLAKVTGNKDKMVNAMKKMSDYSSDAAVADAQKKLRESFR